MTWRIDDPQGNESAKCKYDIVPYTRGKVLDLGCGPFKAFQHFTGVDNGHHAKEFGWQFEPDIHVDTCEVLEGIETASCDAVFSSHLLEHIENYQAALMEWWRVIKPGGYMILYLPHKHFYPNVGEYGSNPDHKHDFLPEDIIAAMKGVNEWDLLVNEEREEGNEYSFLQVYQKLTRREKRQSWRNRKPAKTACVVRYGGFGDMLQASSLLPQLKAAGYHVTFMTTPKGKGIVELDPNVDAWVIQDNDQVPNNELTEYWKVWTKKFDLFVNLCESVEGTMLAMPGRANHSWPDAIRHKYMNKNYLEWTHELAGLHYHSNGRFYPSPEEKKWAKKEKGGNFAIYWALAGSSVHKAYPHTDEVIARVMLELPEAHIYFTGDDACRLLEQGWQEEPRVHCNSGEWSIRESLSFAQVADIVVGPETGILNAVAFEPNHKIIMLSHSSIENLSKHWINTVSLTPVATPCYPCHRLHYSREFCPDKVIPISAIQPEELEYMQQEGLIEGAGFNTGASLCAYNISAERVFDHIKDFYENR